MGSIYLLIKTTERTGKDYEEQIETSKVKSGLQNGKIGDLVTAAVKASKYAKKSEFKLDENYLDTENKDGCVHIGLAAGAATLHDYWFELTDLNKSIKSEVWDKEKEQEDELSCDHIQFNIYCDMLLTVYVKPGLL